MTGTVDRLATLRATHEGRVVAPGDADYDELRRAWNADVDRSPTVIARCRSAADVAAAVLHAQAEDLEIAVRCGTHSMSGHSSVDGGLLVDLREMNTVVVDPVAKRARVGGGALLGDLDAATQAHGLAVPLGAISHTGVGGLALGGGMGWLTRQAGLSIDNLESAEVVLADGRVVRAGSDSHPDLFWAIRGGGGNFGVVTEFEFRLHEVGPIVAFGLLFWEAERAGEALRMVRELVADLPRSCNVIAGGISAPPAPFVPQEHHFRPGIVLALAGFGDPAEHAAAVERARAALPPLFEQVGPMPYTALQQLLDEANGWGLHNYEKSTHVSEITDEVVAVLAEHLTRRSSPLSVTLLYRLDEAFCEPAEDATAFGGSRRPQWGVFNIGISPTPELLPAERAWARGIWEALQPHALGAGAYVNTMSEQEEHRVRAAYGSKYDRLARIKAEYDPGNVFHRNINIKPA